MKSRVDELEIADALTQESGLQKCKGVMCKGCSHAVWIKANYSGPIVIGCDISTVCADFERLPCTRGDYIQIRNDALEDLGRMLLGTL